MAEKFTFTAFDPEKYLDRYRKSGRGILQPGLDDTWESVSMRTRIETRLVPAPWSYVLMIAIVYAFGINVVKQSYYFFFGRLNVTPAAESIEEAPPYQPN